MAQHIVTICTDDLTGEHGEDVAGHTFSLDGVTYEIDLGPESHQKLLDALSPFLRGGRKAKSSTGRRTTKLATNSNGSDPGKVREWARSQGIKINDRGRVPRDVSEMYEAAH